MDFHKFRDLFANEELYFRQTDLFKETDLSEALPSDEYVRAACGLRKYHLDDERALNNNQAFARHNSEAYFISCWQLFEAETLDMWKTYGNGVAVFSRFDFLKSAVATMLEDIFLGIVHYGEKDMTSYNLIRFLYTKRRCFLKERELRVVLQCYDPVAGSNRHYDLNNFAHREPLDELNPVAGELLFHPRFLTIPRPATILRCAIWPFFSSISSPPWLGCSVLAVSVPSLLSRFSSNTRS